MMSGEKRVGSTAAVPFLRGVWILTKSSVSFCSRVSKTSCARAKISFVPYMTCKPI